ncbi:MAG: hypothetical protein DRI56_10360 [Chloroflexota bacterium]|nr:MAG: hypothetical protein B6243_04855 [Anaerolineaceae bacterium 4572_5.2]RLD04942.1 MAG: hypothetical protein DRI56_10360 [Chloroflexota bacterium]
MLKRTSNLLHRVTNGWVALAALATFLAFTAFVLPRQAAKAETQTGTSASPDTSYIYSPDDLYQMAETYGEKGRQAYVRARFTFDLIFPIIYTFFLVTATSWLAGKTLNASSPWMRVNLIPVLGMIFDYLENTFASLVMWRYPTKTLAAFLTPAFTFLKWIFIIGSFLLLIIGIIGWLWQWGKGKRR